MLDNDVGASMLEKLKNLICVLLICLASCSKQKEDVTGRWVSNQTQMVSLYFYPDHTASLSGTGFLNLRWELLDDGKTVKIEALSKNVIFHFRIENGSSGPRGTLELAGYEHALPAS